jgi:hypothetical protein
MPIEGWPTPRGGKPALDTAFTSGPLHTEPAGCALPVLIRRGVKNKPGLLGFLPSEPRTRSEGRNIPVRAIVLRHLPQGISSLRPGTLIKA